jgi:inosine/xanthosine triphosphate pyrophosphatase family protein
LLFWLEDEGQSFGELPPERRTPAATGRRAVRALVQADLAAVPIRGKP